jgi:integrase
MPHGELATLSAASAARSLEPVQLGLFGDHIDMEGLRMERAAIAGAKRSASTVKTYAKCWRDFASWCTSAGRSPLPASADTVSLYAVHLARAGRLPATIAQRIAAVVAQHGAAGFASPAPQGGVVREVLAGLGRRLGTAPRHAKAAVSVEELRQMVAAVDGRGRRGVYSWQLSGGAARAARDRAVLLFGFASGLRRSELVALELGDVRQEDAGLAVHVRRSKTDQEGAGVWVAVHKGRRKATCPVRALAAWLVERGSWPGALFCAVSTAGAIERRHLDGSAIAEIVQGAAKRAGLDASRYGAHSLRAGLATAAAAAGAGELAIAARTRHTSLEMVRRYIRHGTLFAVDPLAGVL